MKKQIHFLLSILFITVSIFAKNVYAQNSEKLSQNDTLKKYGFNSLVEYTAWLNRCYNQHFYTKNKLYQNDFFKIGDLTWKALRNSQSPNLILFDIFIIWVLLDSLTHIWTEYSRGYFINSFNSHNSLYLNSVC